MISVTIPGDSPRRRVAESRRRHGDNVITPPKRRFGVAAARSKNSAIRSSASCCWRAVLSLAIGFIHKEFHRIHRHHLRHHPGYVRRLSGSSGTPMRRFRRLNQVNDDISVKVMREEARSARFPRREVVVGDVVYTRERRDGPRRRRTGRGRVAARSTNRRSRANPRWTRPSSEAAFRPRGDLSVERGAARHDRGATVTA